jgi:hypothetical protein
MDPRVAAAGTGQRVHAAYPCCSVRREAGPVRQIARPNLAEPPAASKRRGARRRDTATGSRDAAGVTPPTVFEGLPERREERSACGRLSAACSSARADGAIKSDIAAGNFLHAAGHLCLSVQDRRPEQARRLVGLLAQGLRHA